MKIHSEMYITWCMKVHIEENNTWYMKVNWKIQCKFADAIIILRDDIRPDSHVTAISHVTTIPRRHIFSALLFHKHQFLPLVQVAFMQDMLDKSYAEMFYG